MGEACPLSALIPVKHVSEKKITFFNYSKSVVREVCVEQRAAEPSPGSLSQSEESSPSPSLSSDLVRQELYEDI